MWRRKSEQHAETAMATEDADPRFSELDAWPLAAAIEAMWDGQMSAVAAVRSALGQITVATDAAAEALKASGRLIYAGAGTSGRVAVQDGTELVPTFSWPPERLIYVLAGGAEAMLNSVEGAEDDAEEGVRQMDAHSVGPHDVVIGVAASGRTPFTVSLLERARERGALTIGVAGNPASALLEASEFPVLLETGSEVLAGSTRMKAGTAQKVALNLISTGIMIRLGRVYKGLMVDMQISNVKLKARAERMVAQIAGCDVGTAEAALSQSGGSIKLAVLLALGKSLDEAGRMLSASGGNLRGVLG
jgi:N-acetylmuramic acid 6-phosphate etherase